MTKRLLLAKLVSDNISLLRRHPPHSFRPSFVEGAVSVAMLCNLITFREFKETIQELEAACAHAEPNPNAWFLAELQREADASK